MQIPNILFLPANRVWRTYPGGKKLDILQGKVDAKDDHFPEDWIGSTTRAVNLDREHLTKEGLAEVEVEGAMLTLKELCEKKPNTVLGKDHFKKYGATTQFLLKFLDSAIRLHIQCHPTIPFAQKHLNSNSGKTEAYVILSIREEIKDPYIYFGFQNAPEKEEFKRIIEEQDIDAMLACFDKIPVKPGDVFMVPGGMPHAIGEGVFMVEIMEPTDFAVRVEFERGGYVLPDASRFMDRGIDFALSMFNYNSTSIEDIKKEFFCHPRVLDTQNNSKEYILIDKEKTACFKVHRIDVKDSYIKKANSFYIGIVTKGAGEIAVNDEHHTVKFGDRFFIPYSTDAVEYLSDSEMEILFTFPPE